MSGLDVVIISDSIQAKKALRKIDHEPGHTLHHLDTGHSSHPDYPAHPGHRKGYSYEHPHHHEAGDISPVLRRTKEGEEVVPLHKRHAKGKDKEGEGVEDSDERIRRDKDDEGEDEMNREVRVVLEDELRG
jgi:hypothetical protein